LTELEHNSQLTLAELVSKVEEKFHIETSISAIHNSLSKMDVTWKNILPVPAEWNTINHIQQRSKFISMVLLSLEAQNRNLIYLDETGFHLQSKSSKGRALAGKPAKLTLIPKGKRITVIGALSLKGLIHHRIVLNVDQQKGTTYEDFRNFLLDLAPKIPQNSSLIMDNAKIHHAEKLESTWMMLKETYGIDYYYLPPYSPFLNPIEYAWNELKKIVQTNEFYNHGELIADIERAIPLINEEKAQSYFSHCKSYQPQCLLEYPFHGKPLNPDPMELKQINNTSVLTLPSSSSQSMEST